MELTKSVVVNGKRYELQRYDMSYRIKMLAKLGKILSGASKGIGSVTDLKNLSLDSKLDASIISNFFSGFFNEVDPEVLPDLCRDFFKKCNFIGENGKVSVYEAFEIHFETIIQMVSLMKEIVLFQFDKDLGGMFNRFFESAATQKETQPEQAKAAVVEKQVKRVLAR